jgi:methyl-accepting chemotaxis protein
MARQRPPASRRGRQPETVLQLGLVLVIAVLFGVATWQSWTATSPAVARATDERAGIRYLKPLTALIGELAEAQSTAVRGGDVQAAAVTSAISAVDAADRDTGSRLQVRRRWADTRKAITEVLAGQPATTGAFEQYGEVIALVRQLVRQLTDTAKLVLDPAVDTAYLANAAFVQLPNVIVGAGRAADLAAIDAAGRADPMARTQIAVARYDVAVAAESVGVGLAKALDDTASTTLGSNITGQLDAFRSAVDSFIPSGTRLRGLGALDAANLARTATTVRQSARPLLETVVGELDSLLRSREDTVGWQRLRALATALLGLIVAVVLGWRLRVAAVAPVDRAADGEPADGAARASGVPRQRGRPETELIDPSDLLAVEELMHAGRAQRDRRGERAADAG